MPRPPALRDPDEQYPIELCGHCRHPGGQHIAGDGCRLCPGCPGWDEERRKRGYWTDRQTDELLQAMENGE